MAAEHVIVMTTTDSEQAARDLAATAIEAGLGACAQIVGPITSVFRWEDEIQTEQEWRVEVKTAADRGDPLSEHLRARHSYDVPEVITVPVTAGNPDYLSWLVDETRR